MLSKCSCGLEMRKVVVTTMEFPDMRMHGADEPIYGDGGGRYWYEGEEARQVDKVMFRCDNKHLQEVSDAKSNDTER